MVNQSLIKSRRSARQPMRERPDFWAQLPAGAALERLCNNKL
jgi:hypothetical protein